MSDGKATGFDVNADLMRASDGSRLWSETYDGKLDDIFAIQQQIGSAIAGALRRKLVRTPALSGPLVTNGEAYNLYLTARGLIRTRSKDVFVTSSNLLRDAIKLDPNYAPAWASLAESTSLEDYPNGTDGLIAALPKAEGYARHALQLAPNLADGHRVLALLLPYGSPEALSHFRRAVELDPNSAEALIGLGSALAAAGDFDAEMARYRRARELDPVWFRTTGQLAIRLAETGQRTEAEAIAKRGFANNESNLHIILGRIAWIFGDFSEAARHWSIVARANSPRWSPRARMGVDDVRIIVGLDQGPPGYKPAFHTVHQRGDVQIATPPAPSAWQMHNRNVGTAGVYRDDNHIAAKLMLKAGRAQELAAMFDAPAGLLSLRLSEPLRTDQLHEAAVVALALQQAGRAADADRLLSQAVLRESVPSIVRLQFPSLSMPTLRRSGQFRVGAIKRCQCLKGQCGVAGPTPITRICSISPMSPLSARCSVRPGSSGSRARLAAHLARERSETVQLRI